MCGSCRGVAPNVGAGVNTVGVPVRLHCEWGCVAVLIEHLTLDLAQGVGEQDGAVKAGLHLQAAALQLAQAHVEHQLPLLGVGESRAGVKGTWKTSSHALVVVT